MTTSLARIVTDHTTNSAKNVSEELRQLITKKANEITKLLSENLSRNNILKDKRAQVAAPVNDDETKTYSGPRFGSSASN